MVSVPQSPDDVPSYVEVRRHRARAVIDDLRERYLNWKGVEAALEEQPGMPKIAEASLRKYRSGAVPCPPDKLEALLDLEKNSRPRGWVGRSATGMPQLLAHDVSSAARLGVTSLVAAEIAWSIRRSEKWDAIRNLAQGSHSYLSSPQAHLNFAKYREVAAALLEVDPERDEERGLAAFVGMRIATSLWHIGRDEDQALVVDTFRNAARHLSGIQRSRILLSDANPLLPESAVAHSISDAQHYALSVDEIFHEFYSGSARSECSGTRTNGIGHQCASCELFRRCQDESKPTHLRLHYRKESLKLLSEPKFTRICDQRVDLMTAFYANAIAGASWAREDDLPRARKHLEAALQLRSGCDTPTFMAFALYWSVVVNRESPWAVQRLTNALEQLGKGARNLCVMPVSRLRADIECLREELITGRRPITIRFVAPRSP